MSTSPISFRRRVRRGALALMVGAILVPASSALAQGDRWYDPPVTAAPATGDNLPGKGDNPADFPGMPGSPPAPAPVATHAPEADGFDWTSAAIGAGGAGLLIVVSLGGATAASRMRFRTMRSCGGPRGWLSRSWALVHASGSGGVHPYSPRPRDSRTGRRRTTERTWTGSGG